MKVKLKLQKEVSEVSRIVFGFMILGKRLDQFSSWNICLSLISRCPIQLAEEAGRGIKISDVYKRLCFEHLFAPMCLWNTVGLSFMWNLSINQKELLVYYCNDENKSLEVVSKLLLIVVNKKPTNNLKPSKRPLI